MCVPCEGEERAVLVRERRGGTHPSMILQRVHQTHNARATR